jgi:hypothetical protein
MRHKSIVSWLARVIAVCLICFIAFHWVLPGMPWRVRWALQNADKYELLSLYPYALTDGNVSGPRLDGFRILGRTTITDSATREDLNHSLIDAAWKSNGEVGSCFMPRHAICVTRNGVTTEVLICFECKQVHVYRDNKEIVFFPITRDPRVIFNDALLNAKLPLAPTTYP